MQRHGNGFSVVPPVAAVRVRPGAYDEYAPAPAAEPGGVGFVPRRGTYLVREVTDARPRADAPMGWQIVARLAP